MTELDTYSDNQLSKLLTESNHDAFTVIFNRYKIQLASNLYKLLRSEQIAQDILQDTFVSLWENRRNLDETKSLKSFIFTIAANKTKNTFRKATTDDNFKTHLLNYYQEDYNPILDNIYKNEKLQLLESLLNKLSPQQKTIIELAKIEQKSHKEIAILLGISEQTVHAHVRDANKKLKNLISSSLPAIATILLSIN